MNCAFHDSSIQDCYAFSQPLLDLSLKHFFETVQLDTGFRGTSYYEEMHPVTPLLRGEFLCVTPAPTHHLSLHYLLWLRVCLTQCKIDVWSISVIVTNTK